MPNIEQKKWHQIHQYQTSDTHTHMHTPHTLFLNAQQSSVGVVSSFCETRLVPWAGPPLVC